MTGGRSAVSCCWRFSIGRLALLIDRNATLLQHLIQSSLPRGRRQLLDRRSWPYMFQGALGELSSVREKGAACGSTFKGHQECRATPSSERDASAKLPSCCYTSAHASSSTSHQVVVPGVYLLLAGELVQLGVVLAKNEDEPLPASRSPEEQLVWPSQACLYEGVLGQSLMKIS